MPRPQPGRRVVLVVCRYDGREPDLERRLQAVYRPWFGPACTVRTRRLPALRTTVAWVGADDLPAEVPDQFAWGDPVGAAGPATDAEVAAALGTGARDLLGAFVLVGLEPDRVRLLVSPDQVHALRHCRGTDGEAWASHGLAAVVASGHRPKVVADRVPELVLQDFVYGDDELLDGVRVLPEAGAVEVRADGAQERDTWPVRERLLSGGGVGADDLLEVLGEVLGRLTAGVEPSLALTAGRDSTLLAGVLAEQGRRLPSFTFGDARSPDGAGAAAVARQLGWEHRLVGPDRRESPSLARLLRATRWSEGLDTAWNSWGPPLRWPATTGTHLYGIGGEMGRAFYWGAVTDPALLADPARLMTGWLASQLAPDAGARLTARAEGFAEQLRGQGWEGTGVLDGWHARGRVRKWPGHTPYPPGVEAVRTVYTSAPVARALLGIPADRRAGAQVFDEAARLRGDLRGLARQAVAGLPAPGRLTRLGSRLRPDVSRPQAERARRELGLASSPVDEAFGATWWAGTRRRRDPAGHRWRWNALAVDALAAVTAELREDPATRAYLTGCHPGGPPADPPGEGPA